MRFPVGSPHRCDGGVVARGSRATTMRESIRLASLGLVGRGQPVLPENSHAIPLGQFSICPENVGIATIRFQSLKEVRGNCMRHLWGTMRVYRAFAGCSQGSRVLPGLAGCSQGSRVPLLPRPRRGFADGEDRAEGLALLRLRRGSRWRGRRPVAWPGVGGPRGAR